MVRSGVLSQVTLGGKHLSAHQVLAPRRAPLPETRVNPPRFLNTPVLNRLHPTPINQHVLGLDLNVSGSNVKTRLFSANTPCDFDRNTHVWDYGPIRVDIAHKADLHKLPIGR